MEESGHIERVGTRDGSALYARCSTMSHHHHIVCDGCGRVAHAECPVVFEDSDARPDGFVITRHEVTLYGLCPSCVASGRRH
jgi:Fe2+ or Zn2+ uptake regulation protein